MKPVAVVAIKIKDTASDWDVVEYVDKETGKVHRIYKYKNKPCKRAYINSRLADQLSGYALIEKDLRSSLIWLREIKTLLGVIDERRGRYTINKNDREKYNIVKGLFVAALTFYGKSFSKCEGRPVKLERSQLAEKYREVHDIAISYRHNFAAHSGAKKLEFVKVALVIPDKLKPGKRDIPYNLYTELFQPDLAWSSGEKEVWFIELFEHAHGVAKEKIEKLKKKILEDEVFPNPPTHFFK